MTKIRQEVIELGLAIKRISPLIADNLAMPMSAEELKYLHMEIGRSYLMGLMFPGFTLADYLQFRDQGYITNAPNST